jgi:hypothetical protein
MHPLLRFCLLQVYFRTLFLVSMPIFFYIYISPIQIKHQNFAGEGAHCFAHTDCGFIKTEGRSTASTYNTQDQLLEFHGANHTRTLRILAES